MGSGTAETGSDRRIGVGGIIPFIPFIPVNIGSWYGRLSILVLTGMEGMKGMGIRNTDTGFEFP